MALTLAEVETAIAAIESGGQSFSVAGMSATAADLSTLMELRDKLKNETDRASTTRPTMRAFSFTGMGY
jgi:hypothetical protein